MSVIEKKVEELKQTISTTELERGNYRLSDAIREGASVTDKAEGWCVDENVCALSAAVIAAKARGYMD